MPVDDILMSTLEQVYHLSLLLFPGDDARRSV